MPSPQIVGLGARPETTMLDHVAGLTTVRKVLWVGTANKEDPTIALTIYERLRRYGDVSFLNFFPWPPDNLRDFTLDHQLIVVGGGNTANMLAIWRVHGFDRVLREAWQQGAVLTGWSAGMICWFEASVTDSFGPKLTGMRDGLGFLPGSACPHYDDDKQRRPVYRRLVSEEGFPPGHAADAAAGIHFTGTELHEVIATSTDARAYRMTPASEEPLPARLI